MKLTVQLVGSLRRAVPGATPRGVLELELPEAATVADVLRRLALSERDCLALLGEERVPPEAQAARSLRAGQTLSLLPPIKGG